MISARLTFMRREAIAPNRAYWCAMPGRRAIIAPHLQPPVDVRFAPIVLKNSVCADAQNF
jgi:hypothetical protein